MNVQRKRIVTLSLLLIFSFVLSSAVYAEGEKEAVDFDDYPSRKINLVLTNSPGGGGDIFYRALAQQIEKITGKPVVVENVNGASGSLAMNELRKRDADGYTFMSLAASEAYAIAHGVIPNKLEDLQPIVTIAAGRNALFTLGNRYETYEELESYALQNPGALKIGSTGTYNDNQVFAMSLMGKAGLKGTYIPYESGGMVDKAIINGDADAAVASVTAVARFVAAGTHNLLAVGGKERMELYPDIPTFRELGIEMDGFDYRGFAAKPGTPQEAIDAFIGIIEQVLEVPEFQEFLANTGQEPFLKKGEEFQKLFENDYAFAKSVFEKFGM